MMNPFTFMANNYRILEEQKKIDSHAAKKAIRIYEFLATCDNDDLCIMVNSSAFNNIIRAYLKTAVTHANLDTRSQNDILDQLNGLFDVMTAEEIMSNS